MVAYYFSLRSFRLEGYLSCSYLYKVKEEPLAPIKSCGSHMCDEWLRLNSVISKK